MKIYAVVFEEPNPDNFAPIKAKWEENDYYIVNDLFVFIAPPKTTITMRIADVVGANYEENIKALVVGTDAYNGLWDRNLLEWLQQKERQ